MSGAWWPPRAWHAVLDEAEEYIDAHCPTCGSLLMGFDIRYGAFVLREGLSDPCPDPWHDSDWRHAIIDETWAAHVIGNVPMGYTFGAQVNGRA